MKRVALYLGLAALFTHELDAVANHEWRLLPVLRGIPDDLGLTLFVAAHIPLFALIITGVASERENVRARTGVILALFLVLHGALHAFYMRDANYEFSSGLSHLLIFGGAICGAIFLGFTFSEWQRNAD